MAADRNDIVTAIAASLRSPDVVSRIDAAIREIDATIADYQRQRNELQELRKMAVVRHGEPQVAEVDELIRPEDQVDLPDRLGYDGTLRGLIAAYTADPDSPYQQLRHATRTNYGSLMKRLSANEGSTRIASMDARQLKRMHEKWSEGGKVAMSHGLITMIRTLASYGATYLSNPECRDLKATLAGMRFQIPNARGEQLTAEHVIAIRKAAHERGLPEIALAQALQFEFGLRQKDVIGEWVPETEPVDSDIHHPAYGKWVRGLLWDEIGDDLYLRHITSKRGLKVERSLLQAPMVLEELKTAYEFDPHQEAARFVLPLFGPMIVYRMEGKPFLTHQFRRLWRKLADQADVPKTVRNMDTRPKTRGDDSDDTDIEDELEL